MPILMSQSDSLPNTPTYTYTLYLHCHYTQHRSTHIETQIHILALTLSRSLTHFTRLISNGQREALQTRRVGHGHGAGAVASCRRHCRPVLPPAHARHPNPRAMSALGQPHSQVGCLCQKVILCICESKVSEGFYFPFLCVSRVCFVFVLSLVTGVQLAFHLFFIKNLRYEKEKEQANCK